MEHVVPLLRVVISKGPHPRKSDGSSHHHTLFHCSSAGNSLPSSVFPSGRPRMCPGCVELGGVAIVGILGLGAPSTARA